MEVYTFDKTFQERLTEYTEILSSSGPKVPASRIKSEWSYHVELVLEPIGWKALWKIPRLTCQDLEIHYPTIVLTCIEHVEFAELTALVKIIAVQDEIHLPDKFDVPLIELYPIKNNENLALDMIGTANCIDQLRFFYSHLWMPWDFDDDDTTNWIKLHLETRLRLFFDMKRGVVNEETAAIIHSLIREGKEIYDKILNLEADLPDEEDDKKCLVDEGKTCQLMKLHLRLSQIKTEMDVLENPAMRDILQRNPVKTTEQIKRRESRCRKPEAYFVWQGGSIEETIQALDNIKNILPADIFLKTTGNLQEALEASETGDKVVIGEGEHSITGAGGLERGGTIRGIFQREKTLICPKENARGSMLDFISEDVVLENVTIHLGELHVGVLVRKGTVKLIGCQIISNKSVVKFGVIVLAGGKLIVENSTFVGLGTAVTINAGGKATLNRCKFEQCVDGIEIHDDAHLEVSNSILSNFENYGIRLETKKYLSGSEGKVGGVELLENIPHVNIHQCTFKNNTKGDVALKPTFLVALSSKDENKMETDI